MLGTALVCLFAAKLATDVRNMRRAWRHGLGLRMPMPLKVEAGLETAFWLGGAGTLITYLEASALRDRYAGTLQYQASDHYEHSKLALNLWIVGVQVPRPRAPLLWPALTLAVASGSE